jgi:hypothetical protein
MSDVPTKVLGERIVALIERVKVLAAERDAFRRETEELKLRLDTHDREHARLRTVLHEAVQELRQE